MIILIDIATLALIYFCINTQINWLKIQKNGIRKTQITFLTAVFALCAVGLANLAKDIFEFETVAYQRLLLFIVAGIWVYYYNGKTF